MTNFEFRRYLKSKLRDIPPRYYNLKYLMTNIKICGNWPPMKGPKKFYFLWSSFMLLISLGHLLSAQTAFIVSGWGDTQEMASVGSFLMNNYIHGFKVILMFRHQKRIQVLLDYANSKKFTCDDPKVMKKLQYSYSWTGFMHYGIFQICGIAAVTGWITSAFLHTLKSGNDRSLPISGSYPYDAFASPFYEITFLMQSAAMYTACVHNISLDGLMIGFMAVVACEFEILKTRIKEIGNDVIEHETSNVFFKRKDVEARLYDELMRCVEQHIFIIAYAEEFVDIFNYMIFLQFLDNCFVICMTAFALSQLTVYTLSDMLGNLIYLGAIAYQLFIYCYFGNDVAIQLFNIWWLQARIRGLLQFIKSEVLCRYYLLYKDISRSYTLSGIFHHIAYQSFGAIGCICLGLIPIADVIAGHGRRLPVEGWYPYNYTRTPAFEFTCAHQTIAILAGCIENVAMDTLVTGFITVACCQLEFLKSNLRRVGVDSLKSANCFHEEVDKELRNCVKHHIAIIEFTNEIQGIFGNMIFLQFLSNCMIICLIAFHITKMKLFVPAELMGMGLYICCVTYQIFIYCWHGNEIMLQSESVVFAAYSGNWWRFGERYKRGLRLLMARANRPLTLTAGNLLTLSLETFVAILRASYSFFTVLQSSTDKTQT